MMKIAGVLILVLVICPTITSATETRGGRDDDLSDDKIWTSLIAFHYPGLVVPPICIEDIAKKCGWNNLTPACVMEEMESWRFGDHRPLSISLRLTGSQP
ncbi:hypothetical protein EE612_041858 [Oryza sativa]|nr:hypothetical protein EE612_041858 [Oryza sativa]